MSGRVAIALALALVVSACGPPAPGPGPYRVQVIDIVDIDSTTGEARFELAERELTTIDNFEELSGRYFQLLRGGTLKAREVAGSLVVDAEFSGGNSPALRYDIESGLIVPLDYSSLAMLSAAYQLEQVMLDLGASIGVTADEIVRDGRYDLLFEPSIQQDGDISATVTIKFNAFYLPGARQFGLARRSRFEEIPLAANRLVLAHEFGHALFEIGFTGSANVECDSDAANSDPFFPGRFDIEYATRGLNEGFADVMSFANAGAINVLSGSGFDADERSLFGTTFTFAQLDSNVCAGEFYCIGTLFARSVFEAFIMDGGDATDIASRGVLGTDVFAAISATQELMRQRGDLPVPRASISDCEVGEEFSRGADSAIVASFLGAFVEAIDASRRASLCERFAANFDEAFPPSARSACP